MPTELLFWNYVLGGTELFSVGQTAVALSSPQDLKWLYLFNVWWLLLLYLSCILQCRIFPWVTVPPLAVLNSNHFWPDGVAEFTLKECNSLLSNGVWTLLSLSLQWQHMANENPFLNMTEQSNPCPSLGCPAQLKAIPQVSSCSRMLILWF